MQQQFSLHEDMKSKDTKQACINCHFFIQNLERHPSEISYSKREAIQKKDYSSFIHASLACHRGIWDEGYKSDPACRHEVIVETDRRNTCFFWEYRPGVLLPAAEKLQQRETESGVKRSEPSQPENIPAVVSGGVDIDSQGDSNIHGDAVGRDKIVNVSVQVSPVESLTRASNPETSMTSNHLELDRQLFLKIREILPSQSMIDVREHDYGGAFPRDMHKDLHNFVYLCKTPECEFIDVEMERLRATLYECINQFLRKIGVYTFPEHIDPMWNRIPRDPYGDLESIQTLTAMAKDEEDFDRRMKEQSERAIRYEQELNDSATESWKAYEEFIRQGRRRLAV